MVGIAYHLFILNLFINMSDLTDGLDRIYKRLSNHTPYRVSQLTPGLSLEEIDEMAQCLPFNLPSEVYELYQWHDGHGFNFIFENYEFPSLRSAINLYEDELKQLQYDYPEVAEPFKLRFPLFNNPDSGVLFTILPDGKNGSPVYIHDTECSNYELRYDNLTNLILHSAEWSENFTFIEDGRESNRELNLQSDIKTLLDIKTIGDIEIYLDTKYMAREHIVREANNIGNGLKASRYKNFIETTSH
jgi:hypothetical protein